MTHDGSVTHWINEVKAGNEQAAQGLWERYFAKLVRLAKGSLTSSNRRVADEEDVALSVFANFCRAAEEGRFPNLSDRDSLWRLLVKMTARKSIDQFRRQNAQRRGGGRVSGESGLGKRGQDDELHSLAMVIGNEPTPEFTAILTEQIDRLLMLLDQEPLKRIAILKMEGFTNSEIAEKFDCSERSIERKLRLIRAKCNESFVE